MPRPSAVLSEVIDTPPLRIGVLSRLIDNRCPISRTNPLTAVQIAPARLYGVRATLQYRLNEPEHERRENLRRKRPLSLTRYDPLEALLVLPQGVAVPLETLPARTRHMVGLIPAWAGRVADGHVTRLAAEGAP